jgi:hypothetical protein
MSPPTTFEDSINAISSAELLDGLSLCSLLDGQKIDQSGPEVAPVSHSRQRAKQKAKQTKDISGQKCSGSFGSANLTQFLANKLRQHEASPNYQNWCEVQELIASGD